jgi:glycerol transport system ATP-binding protein
MIGVVGLLDSVQNFNTGEVVRVQFDTLQLYVFDQNEQLVSSPYRGLE